MEKQRVHFENLDALRTIAFLLVFSEHVWWSAFDYVQLPPFISQVLYAVFANGPMGVSVFFTLSGFLITYLILTETGKNGRLHVKAFYVRRTLRIWPLYFVLLAFVFILLPLINQLIHVPYTNPANPWYHVAFLSNFDVIRLDQQQLPNFLMSGITWSIAIEEQFYLLWPLLFAFVPLRYFVWVFVTFILVNLGFRYAHAHEPVYIYMHSLGVCGDLAVGGLSAFLVMRYNGIKSFFTHMQYAQRILIYSIGISFILFKDNYLDHPYALVYYRLLSTVFFAFVILDQCFNSSARGKLGKSRLLTVWGKYTYGLYLLHPVGLWLVTLAINYADIEVASFWLKTIFAVVVLICTCTFAFISYHMLEKPFLKLKDKFSYITNK